MTTRRRWPRFRALGLVLAAALCGCGSSMSVDTSWSPDNERIVYAAENGLYLYDMATKQPRELPLGEGGAFAFAPSWSPNGRAIAFFSVTATPNRGGRVELRTVNPDSGPDAHARFRYLAHADRRRGDQSREEPKG